MIVGIGSLAVSLTVWAVVGNLPTGFSGKTVWNWIDVLGVPLAVAAVAGLFAIVAPRAADRRADVERELNTDREREAALRTYLDRMTDLVLHEGLDTSGEGEAVRAVAHAETFVALRGLNGPRKGMLIQFLHDSKLIPKENPIVSLSQADLTGSDLSHIDLRNSALSGANLRGSDLYYTDLSEADLSDVNLSSADLHNAILGDADLSRTNLQDAIIYDANLREANLQDAIATDEQLREAYSLVGATMPDGSEMTEELWEQFQRNSS